MVPEQYAVDLLTKLKVNNLPIDPFQIANRLDVKVFEVDAEGYEGCLIRYGQTVFININKNIENKSRKKFTLSHELGHYTIPSHKGINYECNAENLSPFSKNTDVEIEANRFASELLLPEVLLKPLVYKYKPDFEDIDELAELCGTSLTATTIKYVSLTEEPCALIVSANNRIKWHSKSSSFNFYIANGHLVAKETLTASYGYDGVPLKTASQKTSAVLWVEGKNINKYAELTEYCIPMPTYGVVLTMLWFDELPSEEDEKDEYRYEESNWKWRDYED